MELEENFSAPPGGVGSQSQARAMLCGLSGGHRRLAGEDGEDGASKDVEIETEGPVLM